jgi:DNA polymerase-3 subunit epsilon
MKKHSLAFVDLETTGTNPDIHEIIEIGCIIAEQVPRAGRGPELKKVDELDIKVRPEHIERAEPGALRVNGYNEADWLFATDLKTALETLAQKTRGCIIVGQNVAFDWGFLEKGFEQAGVTHAFHDYHMLDLPSMAYAKLYDDGDYNQKFGLRFLCERFGVKNEKAHTAMADIEATFEVYKKLMNA